MLLARLTDFVVLFQLLMFNLNLSLKELYDAMLEILVNNSKMRSDSLIGSFKMDLGNVHEQPGEGTCFMILYLTPLLDFAWIVF